MGHGNWCMTDCPDGFFDKSSERCEQLCGGDFLPDWHADGMRVCGKDPGTLRGVVAEMVTSVVTNGFKVWVLVSDMKQGRVNAQGLARTMLALLDAGKPFARPMC